MLDTPRGRADHDGRMNDARILHPLRAVTQITETGRRGTDIGPNCFWLAREFLLSLECEHINTRTRDVYYENRLQSVIDSFPKRVRCTECPGRAVAPKPRAPKPVPDVDPLAVALGRALAGTVPEREAETYRWIAAQRGMQNTARVYADVALALIEVFTQDVSSELVADVHAALDEWGSSPIPENAQASAKAARRLYSAQNRLRREGSNWHSIRGIIAARKATPDDIVGALSWLGAANERFYDKLLSARRSVNVTLAQRDYDELVRIWSEERTGISVEHVPVLDHLISVYEGSRARA